ncbi:hypothetical protein CORC01_07858 [Colletotrichum orchidophilum]|uniref:Uncharacterized protein n=1 Tax=Colletotrichum orchidophilum TaxID=1209926 RepID=A0A1G4B652_9PEZI|nr:uncharacterized protein CORC01_07858 [Colletotrichum orchidophilum]OHE96891.1 hypothetical protein CORC01_07858 [Colletotrichum orchidophilum]
MTSLNPSLTSWKPAALPLFTGLLALLGAADGCLNLAKPEGGAATFGLVPPPRDTVTPAQFDAFHHALVKVKGARNLHMSLCILGLVLYGHFSGVCRASPLAAVAVRRCLGIVLTLGSGVGFSGAAVVSEYLRSPGASEEAIAVGKAKAKAHLITNVPIVALGLIYLVY